MPVQLAADEPKQVLPRRLLAWADRRRRWLFAAVVLVYLAGFTGQWRIEPDSALYLSLARNLAEGRGYTYHDQPHRLAYPGLPYLLAGTFRIFGSESLWPAHAMMLLFGLAALALVYRLICLHADRPTAVVVTCGVGLTRLFYRYAFYLMTDMPFLVGVLGFLVGYEAFFARERFIRGDASVTRPRWFDWVVMLPGLALAVSMRPAVWSLLLAILGAVAWAIRRGRWRLVPLVAGLVLVAVVLFFQFDPRQGDAGGLGDYERVALNQLWQTEAMFRRMFNENLPQILDPLTIEAFLGFEIGPGLNAVAGALLIGLGVGLVRRRVLWGLLVGATVLMMAVVLPVDRYYLPVLPLLVFAWWRMLCWVHGRLPRRWANAAFVGLLVVGAVPNAARVGGVIIEQRQRPFLEHYKDGRFPPLIALAEKIRANTEPNAVVLAPFKTSRVLSWYSRRRVVELVEYPRIDPAAQPLYVVGPMEPPMRQWLRERGLRRGPQVADFIARKNLPPLLFYRVAAAPATRP